jgi:diguanylate cyclase (GGDEF)-like protein/PAS domain S-box-containing protein
MEHESADLKRAAAYRSIARVRCAILTRVPSMPPPPSHPRASHRASIGLETLPQPAMLLDVDGRVLELNDLAAAMLGLPAEAVRESSPTLLGDLSSLRRWLAGEDGPSVFRQRVELRRANGVPVTFDVSARRYGDAARRQAICLFSELSGERLAAEAQRYIDVAFEAAPIGMAFFNTDGQYIRVNSSLCEMLGRPPEELLGRRDQEFTHPDDRRADVVAAWRILNGELDTWQCEKRFLRPDGSEVWAIANLTFLRSSDGHPLSWLGQFQDITERKEQEAGLRELADRDPLTGLFNRRCLEAKLADLLDSGHRGAVLVADLDGFKEVNDRYGHRAGDLVLVGIASALRESVRREDIIARIGGDEFAVVLTEADEQEAHELADVVEEVVGSQRFGFDPSACVSASVGVTSFGPEGPSGAGEALARADSDMYRSKRERRTHGRLPAQVRRATAGSHATGGSSTSASAHDDHPCERRACARTDSP